MSYHYTRPPHLVHRCVWEVAKHHPEALAIDEGLRQMTYGELALKSDQLALYLKKCGILRGARIGIFAQNSIESTLGIISSLRADACYVPINPDFPDNKIADIFLDAQIEVVLVSASAWLRFQKFQSQRPDLLLQTVVLLDQLNPCNVNPPSNGTFSLSGPKEWGVLKGSLPQELNTCEDLAYIIYTSGTTGKPKGVMLMHSNVTAFADWINRDYDFRFGDRVSHHNRISFDFSVMDIFACFFAGGVLCPVIDKGEVTFPGNFINRLKINIWISVPSSLNMMMKAGQMTEHAFPSLKLGFVCGEILRKETAAHWLKTHPTAKLINLYGPTEAAVACTAHTTCLEDANSELNSIPIGLPSPNTEILLVNGDGQVLENSLEVGRLLISGPQVAPGYWRKTELTENLFILHPQKKAWYRKVYDTGDLALRLPDGKLVYIGREDQQVQVMGFRVELTEIEAAYESHPACSEVAVVFDEQRQWLILAISTPEPMDEKQLAKELFSYGKAHLPEHMVPKKYICYENLPKNNNGKVDRKLILKDHQKN